MKSYFANRQGQDLAQHSVLVARLARSLVETLYGRGRSRGEGGAADGKLNLLKNVVYKAGLLHDIGKLDTKFQTYLRSLMGGVEGSSKRAAESEQAEGASDGEQIDESFEEKRFSFAEYPRHEEVSWLLLTTHLDSKKIKSLLGVQNSIDGELTNAWSMLKHAVYWHHAKPLRVAKTQAEHFGDKHKIIEKIKSSESQWIGEESLADLKELLRQIEQIETKSQAASSILSGTLIDSWGDVEGDPEATPAFKGLYVNQSKLETQFEVVMNTEAQRTIVRSVLVSADRIVSALTSDELVYFVESNTLPKWKSRRPDMAVFHRQIEMMVERFAEQFPGDRTTAQVAASSQLTRASNEGIVCLQGPAGCGKSKIALNFISEFQRAQAGETDKLRRVFMIVPRTAIGESLFNEMVADYEITEGVELLTGAKKLYSTTANGIHETTEEEQGAGNLVICTIDQLSRTMLSHHRIDVLSEMADSHVMFDEFHELADLPAISLLFLEIMRLRQLSDAATLLISATPNQHLLTKLGVEPAVVRVETFNVKPIYLDSKDWSVSVYGNGLTKTEHPFVHGHSASLTIEHAAFVISNTATVAQAASISHKYNDRNVLCFHSKFTAKDKSRILRAIIQTFGSKSTVSDEILISGPIVQASLNITTKRLHTEGCHAENFLQRIGRLNRFATFDDGQATIYWAPKNTPGGPSLANADKLGNMHQRERTVAFYRYLSPKLGANGAKAAIRLTDLYAWYDEFHVTAAAKTAYEADFRSVLTSSCKVFANNDFDPIQVPVAIKKKNGATKGSKLSRNSLRGRSYFILPLRLQVDRKHGRAVKSLLWNALSAQDEVLSDELLGSGFDTATQNKYTTWSKDAHKPTVLSPLVVGVVDAPFLRSLAKFHKRFKLWNPLKLAALDRATPVVVSKERYEDDALIYLEIDDLKIGLVKSSKCFRSADFDLKKLM